MTAILAAWIQGVLLGVGVAAPFGPINVEIVRRHFSVGLFAGLLLGLGACSVDTLYILAITLARIRTGPGPVVQAWLALPAAAMLLVLASLIVRGARRAAQQADAVKVELSFSHRLGRHYLVGLVMTAASPLNLVFWIAVIAGGRVSAETPWGSWPVVAGVVCGTVGWVVSLNLALRAGRRWITPRALRLINWSGAAILVCFAARGLWDFVAVIVLR